MLIHAHDFVNNYFTYPGIAWYLLRSRTETTQHLFRNRNA